MTSGGAGGGEDEGEREVCLKRRCLRRRGGVGSALVGFRSGSTRSSSDADVLARLGGAGEEVEKWSWGLLLGCASHGRVRGGIFVPMLDRVVLCIQ